TNVFKNFFMFRAANFLSFSGSNLPFDDLPMPYRLRQILYKNCFPSLLDQECMIIHLLEFEWPSYNFAIYSKTVPYTNRIMVVLENYQWPHYYNARPPRNRSFPIAFQSDFYIGPLENSKALG